MSIFPTTRQEKADQTRQMIVESAISLFRQYDIEKVTIDDICMNCGVTKGSFYHNFTSKDHIVTIVINILLDKHIKEHFTLTESEPLLDQVTALLLCGLDFFKLIGKKMTRKSYECQVRSCIEVRIQGRSFVEMLTALVRRGLAEDGFQMSLDEDNTYMMFIAVYTGMLLKWSTQSDNLDATLNWERIIHAQLGLMIKN